MRRLFIFLLVLLGTCFGPAATAELVVVVNARSGVAAISRNEVINLFLGRSRQFFNGSEAQAVDLADGHPDRARFYRELLGREISQVDAYWSRQLFSGKAQPLPRVANGDEVLRWVVSHPGGIGYIEAAKVDARVRVILELSH